MKRRALTAPHPEWKLVEVTGQEGSRVTMDVVGPQLVWITVRSANGDLAGAGLAPVDALACSNALHAAHDASRGWRPVGANIPRRVFTNKQLEDAVARNDTLADRGVKPQQVLEDHGFPDHKRLTEIAFQHGLHTYAMATGQMQLSVGYQPILAQPPRTVREQRLWALLSGMWIDGFTKALIMTNTEGA